MIEFAEGLSFVRNEGMVALLLILFALFITLEVYRDWAEKRKETLNLKRWHRVSFRLLRRLFFTSLGYRDTS